MTLNLYPAWASKVFRVSGFQQIRAVFHPEIEKSTTGDKVHQLQYVLNYLNTALKRTFVPGLNLSFDKGGIALRSKFCPVRQYNQSKPDKIFLLGNCTTQMYFIKHCAMYQGKNVMNADIPCKIQHLPTTQKAVVTNTVIKTGIALDPEGMR